MENLNGKDVIIDMKKYLMMKIIFLDVLLIF
jgi:hypothetical protein